MAWDFCFTCHCAWENDHNDHTPFPLTGALLSQCSVSFTSSHQTHTLSLSFTLSVAHFPPQTQLQHGIFPHIHCQREWRTCSENERTRAETYEKSVWMSSSVLWPVRGLRLKGPQTNFTLQTHFLFQLVAVKLQWKSNPVFLMSCFLYVTVHLCPCKCGYVVGCVCHNVLTHTDWLVLADKRVDEWLVLWVWMPHTW